MKPKVRIKISFNDELFKYVFMNEWASWEMISPEKRSKRSYIPKPIPLSISVECFL